MRPRPLVVYVIYVTGIHVARAESRIFVASAPSQVHSEEIPVFSFEAQSCIRGYHIYKAVRKFGAVRYWDLGPFSMKSLSQL